VEFNEIRLQTNFNDDFQFVYTDSNTYQYKFANLRWQPIRTILLFPLINPPTFSLPITVPNALGRETKYQAYLTQVQNLPNNIHILMRSNVVQQPGLPVVHLGTTVASR